MSLSSAEAFRIIFKNQGIFINKFRENSKEDCGKAPKYSTRMFLIGKTQKVFREIKFYFLLFQSLNDD
jgi:hypothetical protein